MPSRYHPIEDGLWSDPKLEGATFEEHGFFAFLCSNTRQRPSGIYRATDVQLAADTTMPVKRVTIFLADLASRTRIVRDGAWIFVKNYLKRQPHQDRLLKGVQTDLDNCDSTAILEAFGQQYPLYSKWSTDRLLQMRANVCTTPTPNTTPNTITVESVDSTVFASLWALHPGPKGPKVDALVAFGQVRPPVTALEALRAQVAHKSECDKRGEFCPQLPHLFRWLRKRRWEDELPIRRSGNAKPAPVDPKVKWKTPKNYLEAMKQGRVPPSERVEEWEATP